MAAEINVSTIADTAMKAAATTSEKAKEFGEKINTATDGQAGKYADIAKKVHTVSEAVKKINRNEKATRVAFLCAICLAIISIVFGGGKKNQFLEEQERVNKMAKSQASLVLLSEKYEGRDVNYSYGSELVWSEGDNCAYLLQITYDQGRKAGNHFYLVPFRDGEYMGMETITYAMTEEEFAEMAKARIEYVTALEEAHNNT